MKNNQLTIDIPEGMEIDLENSDLANCIIRFKHKKTTYVDIEDALNLEGNRTAIAADVRNVSKLSAIDKLINIARYYNKGWKPSWNSTGESKYYIYYSHRDKTYGVLSTFSTNYGDVYFRSHNDAQYVIDNPNFRNILDAIYKN